MGHLTDEEISHFCDSWCEAEDSLKHVESEIIELPQQPINELRYATRHFIRSFKSFDRSDCLEQYHAAMRHCTCAGYDTAEAVLLFRCLRFKEFQQDFADFPIETPVLDYGAALLAYQSAQEALSRDPGSRHQRKSAVQQACDALTQYDRILDSARNELNKKRARAPQSEHGTASRFKVQLIITIIVAIFTAACTLGVKLWFDRDHGSSTPRPTPPVSSQGIG